MSTRRVITADSTEVPSHVTNDEHGGPLCVGVDRVGRETWTE